MDNFLFVPRALAAALFDIAFACTAGVLLANLLLPAGCNIVRPSNRRFIIGMIVALAAQAWFAAAVATGSSTFEQVRSALPEVLTGTHAGEVTLVSLVCAVLPLLCSAFIRGEPLQTRTALFFFATLTAVRAVSGHAASDGNFSLREFVQFLHLASIAIWSGGVIVAGLLIMPKLHHRGETEDIKVFAVRLSRAATIALLFVVASGAYNSYRGVGLSLAPLCQGAWGTLLIAKVAMVCIAICLGAYSRGIISSAAAMSDYDTARLLMALRVESAMMVAILTISAFLANSAPPLVLS
jgi:putative copper resistance protein D